MEHNNKLYLTSNDGVLFDDHYRYKISVLLTSTVFKKGTYITVLDNFEIFCKELMFDKKTLIKIIGKMLHCKSGVNKNEQYYLQGVYQSEHVKQTVYDFIKSYLLCTYCDKPEVTVKHKNNKIKQKCKACGKNTYLENAKEEIVHIFKHLDP